MSENLKTHTLFSNLPKKTERKTLTGPAHETREEVREESRTDCRSGFW